jgi:hypothetical protein
LTLATILLFRSALLDVEKRSVLVRGFVWGPIVR